MSHNVATGRTVARFQPGIYIPGPATTCHRSYIRPFVSTVVHSCSLPDVAMSADSRVSLLNVRFKTQVSKKFHALQAGRMAGQARQAERAQHSRDRTTCHRRALHPSIPKVR